MDLKELETYCRKCQKCNLGRTRNNAVFGQGNENADIMLVGEGPGYNEDIQGVPFVGKAGQLLDKMLLAVELSRNEIYITNIVKCRPPNNRNPLEDESRICLDYLRYQVKLIQPKIIVCLGAVSARNLIRPNLSITRERGNWTRKGNIDFIPTLHPAYLLRNPSAKKDSWADLKSIREHLDALKK
ncbi:DNA polymerase [Dethiosulfatibacter aminovorans DSM 17477]|uniref:Type-4 uracil-DNA glycosylase n=1 Tax=Dethiosulfatibacter aminovorans DSM 17477 TaxID=1121476 RepID=A0A1M6HIN9_9FIRM|nr:uracil-DNA glycosylase [Dethiosulfatibacter aminovorans]SHJ22053.1 DNA polymerase [Dethiosulfatibacter aminovorans DSM 17477]